MKTLGQVMESAINEVGIGGMIFGMDASIENPFEVTIYRGIIGTDGQVCLRHPGDTGGEVEVALVAETFNVHTKVGGA